MFARLNKGDRVEERLQLCDAGTKGLRPYEPGEAEHAGFAQLVSTAGNQGLSPRLAERVQRPAIEIQNLPHGSSRNVLVTTPAPSYSQPSSSG